MRIVAIVQARQGSTRLPGKALAELAPGRPVLGVLLDRLVRSKMLDTVVVATTREPRDREVAVAAKNANPPGSTRVLAFCGDEDDVLGRYYDAALRADADIVVRVTGDCPLVDPILVDACVMRFVEGGYDYISNCHPVRTMPRGFEVEVFTRDILTLAHQRVRFSEMREHVTPYLHDNVLRALCHAGATPRVRTETFASDDGTMSGEDLPNLSIDTADDLARVRAVWESLGHRLDFGWREAVEAVRRLP